MTYTYTYTYIATCFHSLTPSEYHRRIPNEQVNDHFYGIILHYYMYGGGPRGIICTNGGVDLSIKFTASQGPRTWFQSLKF